MKAYYYTPQDCGMAEFPSGLMRLAGAEEVDPSEADVFVLPTILRALKKDRIYRLPYLKGNEKRHVFWNCAEDVNTWFDLPSLFIRCDATQEIKAHDPNTIGWPWPVEDWGQTNNCFVWDVVFQGWASTPLTNIVVESVQQSALKSHLRIHSYFFGYHYNDPEYQHLKASYRDTLSKSRLSLVPRSIPEGVVRYRFYEAMAMGRVSAHFCDGRVMPFEREIDWDKCSIHIREEDAPRAGQILAEWLSTHPDEEIYEMGRYARQVWERYLDSRKWNQLFAEVVEKHLDSLGMAVRS